MLIDKFAFQGVEVTLHMSVVIRTPGTAHALRYAVKYHAVFSAPMDADLLLIQVPFFQVLP